MTPLLIVAAVTAVAQAHPPPGRISADLPGMACLSIPESRDIMIAQKTIAPFRAVGEAMRDGGGDLVALRLCRLADGLLLYDVAVLRRDGRLVHVYVDARTGEPRAGRR